MTDCGCWTCKEGRKEPIMFYIFCAECGNKRCPHANDHRNTCTGSNAVGQSGSAYQYGSGAATTRRFRTFKKEGTP